MSAGLATRILLLVMAFVVAAISFGLASGTVMAGSATDQYTEPEVPRVPGANPGEKPINGGGGSGKSIQPGGVDGANTVDKGQRGDWNLREAGEQRARDGQKSDTHPPDGGGQQGEKSGTNDSEAAGAAGISAADFRGPGGGLGGRGGGAVMLIAGLLVGVPLVAGAGYALYSHHRRSSRDGARKRLEGILNGPNPTSSEKP